MAEIAALEPHEIEEARRMIYAVAFTQFPTECSTLEEAVARFSQTWPLHDLDDYQQRYVQGGGAFLATREGGRIIGTGALRRLEEGVGEIKRLWLLPEFQGRGLGYQMMLRLLEIARQKGYAQVRLETSPDYQPRAFTFYQRLGFRVIPRYGDDPDDVGMELDL